MVCCAAFNCSNQTDKNPEGKLSFHVFPKDVALKKKWLISMKRDRYVPSRHARLCSEHFTPSCFQHRVFLSKEFGLPCKRLLKLDACPTIFDFGVTKPEVKERTAVLKRRRKEIIDRCIPISTAKRLKVSVSTTLETPDISHTGLPDDDDDDDDDDDNGGVITRTNMYNQFCQTTGVKCMDKETQASSSLITEDSSFQTDFLKCEDRGTQFDFTIEDDDEDNEKAKESEPIECDDPEWRPEEEELYDDEEENPMNADGVILGEFKTPMEQSKFIVFESCLVKLFKCCCICFQPSIVTTKKSIGSMVIIEAKCSYGHIKTWDSQPVHKRMPLGNLLLAASSLATGCNPVKTVNLLKHMNVKVFGLRTYHWMQSAYICPAIDQIWLEEKNIMAQDRIGKHLKLGGDARCCSPGHTAKYGSYSLMDLETSTILEMQLIQSNEVKNSNAMELEGLQRCLAALEGKLMVSELTTDRHVQVKKYMRIEKNDIQHWFDVWHVAKGVKKKLEKRAKKKGLGDIGLWTKSISNHLYWCAASSDGNGPLVVEKWKSILNHISNIHEGHSVEFPQCLHNTLTERQWIDKGSRVHKNIEEIVTSKPLLKDVPKLAPHEQTSAVESYHNIVCFFAPKHDHFFYKSMLSRLHLACLHFNENSMREQAVTSSGKKQWRVSYKKANKGQPVATEVKVPVSYGYVEKVLTAVYEKRLVYPSYRTAKYHAEESSTAPPFVATKYDRVEKDVVVNQRLSRFSIRL